MQTYTRNASVEASALAMPSTEALRIYVCNVATQPGETDEFRASDHVKALLRHVRGTPIDVVLANSNQGGDIKPEWQVQHVGPDVEAIEQLGVEVALFDVVDPHNALRHSPERLTAAIAQLYERRRANGNGAARSAPAASAV